jgi:nicotinamide-nucleotide adenylyltransferase
VPLWFSVVARPDALESRTVVETTRYAALGMVARWKPVHLGHAAVLRGLLASAPRVLLGIGSSNRYDVRSPFTAAETRDMIRLVIGEAPGVTILDVPDLGDGPRWRGMVADIFGALDAFVTDNPYVASLMRERYRVMRTVEFVAPEDRVAIDGTTVRRAMAKGEDWRELVPSAVAEYIEAHGLDVRFRREFGLETLAADVPTGAG